VQIDTAAAMLPANFNSHLVYQPPETQQPQQVIPTPWHQIHPFPLAAASYLQASVVMRIRRDAVFVAASRIVVFF